MKVLPVVLFVPTILLSCAEDDQDFGPMRRTSGGFLVTAADFSPVADEVDVDAATEEQFEILLAKNPSLDRAAARRRLAAIPLMIRKGYRYQVPTRLGYVWVTGDTDGHSYVRVALESFNAGAGGAPFLPALNHEWGHVVFGGGYEH